MIQRLRDPFLCNTNMQTDHNMNTHQWLQLQFIIHSSLGSSRSWIRSMTSFVYKSNKKNFFKAIYVLNLCSSILILSCQRAKIKLNGRASLLLGGTSREAWTNMNCVNKRCFSFKLKCTFCSITFNNIHIYANRWISIWEVTIKLLKKCESMCLLGFLYLYLQLYLFNAPNIQLHICTCISIWSGCGLSWKQIFVLLFFNTEILEITEKRYGERWRC